MFTITDAAATDFTYASDTSGVTVSAAGVVTVAAGTAAKSGVKITATGKSGGATDGLSANKTFNIV